MKRFLSLVMALCVLLLSLGTISINAATTLEGAGTAESPYLIKSTEDFLLIGTSDYPVTAEYYLLTDEVNLTNDNYTPIEFKGSLKGWDLEKGVAKQRTITLDISTESQVPFGLFSKLTDGFVIKNITLKGTVSGKDRVGALVGEITAAGTSEISTVTNEADITATGSNIGGVAGRIYDSVNSLTFKYVTNLGNVTGNTAVGGVVGLLQAGSYKFRWNGNYGNVTGSNTVGGVVGQTYSSIDYMHNAGTVTANSKVGGVVGMNSAGSATIGESFNIGKVIAKDKFTGNIVAGILGHNPSGKTVKFWCCYNAGKTFSTVNNVLAEVNQPIYPTSIGGTYTVTSCYYIGDSNAEYDTSSVRISKEVAGKLETYEGFNTSTWKIDNEVFMYPQVKGTILVNGYENTPYLINSGADFQSIENHLDKYHLVTKSFELNDENYTRPVNNFEGTISALKDVKITLNRTAEGDDKGGLFDTVTGDVCILDITVDGVFNAPGSSNVSAFVGKALDTTAKAVIKNCINNADVSAKASVGGFVGRNYNNGSSELNQLELTGLVNNGNITGEVGSIGGIVGIYGTGDYSNYKVNSCENNGKVTGDIYVGGIVGISYSQIKDCVNQGTVQARNYSAGIAGRMASLTGRVILSCINTGKIISQYNGAGIVASVTGNAARINGCYDAGVLTSTELFPIAPEESNFNGMNYYLSSVERDNADNTTAMSLSEMKESETLPPKVSEFINTLYVVNSSAGENGSVNLEGEHYVRPNDTITYHISADKYYRIASANIGYEIYELTGEKQATYTTEPVTSDMEFNVTFEVIPFPSEIPDAILVYVPESYKESEFMANTIIRSPYAICFGKVSEYKDYTLNEYGIVISDNNEMPEINSCDSKAVAEQMSSEGQFGVLFHGKLEKGNDYFVRTYASYVDTEGNTHILYGAPSVVKTAL